MLWKGSQRAYLPWLPGQCQPDAGMAPGELDPGGVVSREPELGFQSLLLLLSCPHSPSPYSPEDRERCRLGGDCGVPGKLLLVFTSRPSSSCALVPCPSPRSVACPQQKGVCPGVLASALGPQSAGLSMVTLFLMTLASHMVSLRLLSFPGPGRVPRLFPTEVFVLYISQEALGPSKHAEKEFCKDPPGDSGGNGASLGKATVSSREDIVGFLVRSVPRGLFSTPLRLGTSHTGGTHVLCGRRQWQGWSVGRGVCLDRGWNWLPKACPLGTCFLISSVHSARA